MGRTVKKATERKREIIMTAEKLFREQGYNATSVEMIIKMMGVAKGTFYYYFKTKEEVLGAIVDATLDQIIAVAQHVADDPDLSALTKLQMLLAGDKLNGDPEQTQEVVAYLHLPANRELHEMSNVQTVLRLSPILATIVEQGNREGVFNVHAPLETVQFLLTGSQFLLDGGLFDWNEKEITRRYAVLGEILERALGARHGTFSFLTQ